MLKTLLIVLALVVALVAGVGGTLGVMVFLHHGGATPSMAAALPPKPKPHPLYFADLSDVTVSIPPDVGAAATSYVAFSVKFSTFDQAALITFDELAPITKAAVIALLMNETGASLQQPQTRVDLVKSCLNIVNEVLDRNANYSPASPFTAAYITNLVVQD